MSTTTTEAPAAQYVDVASVLAGGLTDPRPTLVRRSDGVGIAYPGRDTVVFGPPGSGKTLLCAYAATEILLNGGSVAWVDVDHNGASAILRRLQQFGVPDHTLADPQQFRLAMPDDGASLVAFVKDIAAWAPILAIIDSIGEVVPMFGRSSNNPDDWTFVHQSVVKPLTTADVAALLVDHEPKGADGATTGTIAKLRTVDGTMLRLSVIEPFVPGKGGAARLSVRKDRHGGLLRECKAGREPLAAVFRIEPGDGPLQANLWAPHLDEHAPDPAPHRTNPRASDPESDAERIRRELPVEMRTNRKLRSAFGWGDARVKRALAALESAPQGVPDTVPTYPPSLEGVRGYAGTGAYLPGSGTGTGTGTPWGDE